ncbi:hypothetical protein, partial [Thiolapillus sp.]
RRLGNKIAQNVGQCPGTNPTGINMGYLPATPAPGQSTVFCTSDWLMSLEWEFLVGLMDTLSTALHVDRHDPQYRTQINKLYQRIGYLLAAEKGKKIRGNKLKIGMDSKRFARTT